MIGDPPTSSAGADAEQSAAASGAREPSVDFYRVAAVVIVVMGHWLVSAVTFRDGRFGNDYPLVVMPWTQWLTLVFQVVPVFFLAGGYASVASWTKHGDGGKDQGLEWVRHRVGAILGPTTVYVVLALATVGTLSAAGVAPSPLAFGGWAIAMHLWFVPVYLVVVALTPLSAAAHRRWGLRVPAALALAVTAIDLAARTTHVPEIGWANYVLCWAAVYQIGICWRSGALRGRRPLLMAAGAVVLLAVLLGFRIYPISMVGVLGAPVQNSSPPSLALLALAAAQAGLLVTVAPLLTRWLRRPRFERPLAAANRNVMALYLWQMVPVVIVALVGYPSGLLPQPEPGTGAWWSFRLVWLVILSAVTAVELVMLWLARAVFDRALPTVVVPLPGWSAAPLLAVGLAIATLTLSRLSAEGFAPHGRIPIACALLYVAAVALLSLVPFQPRDHGGL